MIGRKLVDRYAHQSGVKDQLVAEREIVLTYALGLLREAGALGFLAFKGGTCLRKIVFGSSGRFSEDLDFTLRTDDDQESLAALYDAFNRVHHGIQFALDEWYETDDGFGMEVRYRHDWNSSGKFRLQVSAREKPTLAIVERAMIPQVYFRDLEFAPFTVPTLDPIEMAAEKVRAAFQRAKVRDLYDLYLLAKPNLDGELLRQLVVLKLWQVRDPFDADRFFEKLRMGDYDWNDLRRLLRPAERVEAKAIVDAIEIHFRALKDVTELEREVIADARRGRRGSLREPGQVTERAGSDASEPARWLFGAASARLRSHITPVPDASAAPVEAFEHPAAWRRSTYRAWGELLKRTFDFDVLSCPSCGGRMKLLAMVTNFKSIARYLRVIGESTDVPRRSPSRGPPFWRSVVLRRKALGDVA